MEVPIRHPLDRFRLPVRIALLLLVATVAGLEVTRTEAGDPPASPERTSALAPDLEALAEDDPAAPVDVFVVFSRQPAHELSLRLKPEYARRIDRVREPALAALHRIDDGLPPRRERAALGVGKLMDLEKALLTAQERTTLRESRDETVRLLAEMRTRILAEARPLCAAVQEPVETFVTDSLGGTVLTRNAILNLVVVRVPASSLTVLVDRFPGIARVERSGRRELVMDQSVGAIGGSSWTSNTYNGSGQKVSIIDTGVDKTHPFFQVSGQTTVTTTTHKLAVLSTFPGFNNADLTDDDLHGHGTHVGGTVGSNDGTYGGVSPGTQLLSAKALTSIGGVDPDLLDAADWSITNGATVMSNSWGGGGTTDGESGLSLFFDAATEVTAVVSAFAAGNSGSGTGTLIIPGDARNVVTVAAFDDKNNSTKSDDSLAGFSSRGPTSDNRRKPDLAAPGVSIVSSAYNWEGAASDTSTKSGTSMACPHVAGSLALLLDYNSAWQPEALKALLMNSVRHVSPVPTSPGNAWGAGELDLAQAYTDRLNVVTGSFTSTGSRIVWYDLGALVAGERATLAWNRSTAFHTAGRRAGNATAKTQIDLDLILYDESDGTADDTSASTVDNTEIVEASAALTGGIVKLHRASSSFPSGQTSQDWALAGNTLPVSVDPPDLVAAITLLPTDVAGAATFEVKATVRNDGDFRAPSPSLTLGLPAGWTVAAATPLVQTVAHADPTGGGGAAVEATWTVTGGSSTGDFSVTISATCAAYGETFTSGLVTGDVHVDATDPVANAGTDVSRFAADASGDTVTLDGAGSSDDSGRALTLEWDTDGDGDFGDGAGSATGAAPSVAFAIGIHEVTLRVTDYVGNRSTDTVSVEIKDNPPSAAAGDDTASDEGSAVAFDGSASTDVEGPVTYAWNFGDGEVAGGAAPSHTFADEGVYTVTLTVTDTATQTDTDTLRVTVSNVPPTAEAGGAVAGDEGSSVQFAGSATDPGINDVLTYAWDFGDGSTGTGPAPSHTYADDGAYTATLTVSDADGGVHADTVAVTISNLPPVAEAGVALNGTEGSSISFAGSATDAGLSDVLTFSWDFGDGSTGTGATPSHIYADDGSYIATLTVSDDDGAGDSDTVSVTISNAPPVADAGADVSGNEGSAVTFAGAATDAGLDDVLTFSWDFGDGASGLGATPSHAYRDDGVYTATMSVTDGDGGTAVSDVTVTIANVAPTADAGSPRTGDEGDIVVFGGSASDPGLDDFLTYAWNFGDGGAGVGSSPTYSYDQDGEFTATMTVTDDSGAAHSDTVQVTVANVAPAVAVPAQLVLDVGNVVVVGVSPTDPSDRDTAALLTVWSVLEGTPQAPGPLLATGEGTSITWLATHAFDGFLQVAVSDDDAQTVETTPLTVNSPPMGESFVPALDLGLDPKDERKLLRKLLGATKAVGAAAGKAAKQRKAAGKLLKIRDLLAKLGRTDTPLDLRLRQLALDLSGGEDAPLERGFVPPAGLGTVEDLLGAIPGAQLAPSRFKKLSKALVNLRFGLRNGASEKKFAGLVKKALKAAKKIEDEALRTWVQDSLAAVLA